MEIYMGNVNISIVAQKAQVSQSTVSRVLNNSPLVKETTANKVRQVIKELGYTPNELARGLRSNETKTVGVIVSNVLNPFFTSIVRGIEDLANKANYHIMLCNTDEKAEKEQQYIQALLSKRVDGLIIASTGTKNDYAALIGNKPVVFVDRKPEGSNKGKFDTVLVHNRDGSRKAVTQLIEAGYQRIGIITGSNVSTTGYERLSGYEQAFSDKKLPLDRSLVKLGDFLGHTAYQNAIDLITNCSCDAIFAANNMILLGVLKAVTELGVKIPNEVGISAFDDLEWMQFCQPQITAVRQPTYKMGTTAMSLLLDRIAESEEPAREINLPVELIVRQSSQNKSLKKWSRFIFCRKMKSMSFYTNCKFQSEKTKTYEKNGGNFYEKNARYRHVPGFSPFAWCMFYRRKSQFQL